MLSWAILATLGIVLAASKLLGPNLARIAAGTGLPLQYVQIAQQQSRATSVPLDWILATILVESSGHPNVRGDADGRSVGLMQVNVVAHAAEMRAAGVTPQQMLDPATNIAWGTKYLRQFEEQVVAALAGRTPPIPLDWIVRLMYKGPTTVLGVLAKGGNPATISWAPAALKNWAAAMARVHTAEGKALVA